MGAPRRRLPLILTLILILLPCASGRMKNAMGETASPVCMRCWTARRLRVRPDCRKQMQGPEKTMQRPEQHLRNYSSKLGCVAATPASPPHVYPCYANFRSLGGAGQQYCDDPYFGGQAKCCYDIALDSCSSCE